MVNHNRLIHHSKIKHYSLNLLMIIVFLTTKSYI